MPPTIQLATQRDYTGGLNLRADQFQLAPNESPELLNMDVDPRGGVRTRPGSSVWALGDDVGLSRYGQFHTDTTHQIWISDGGPSTYTVYVGDPEGPDVLEEPFYAVTSMTSSAPFAGAQFKGNLYLASGQSASYRWNGTTATSLGATFANDFASPGSGNMPRARQIAVHQNHLWLADTTESSTRHPRRLRFSHPGQPEAWRTLDWIDLDPGVDGDAITNLVPFQDHLLAFTSGEVYAVFGFGWDSWSVQPASREVGAVNPGAAVATPAGVYFFDWPNGVMRWDGRKVEWAFERLVPALRDGTIPAFRRDEIRMGWADNRLWVSVPWKASEHRVLVLDPSLGKEGSWVMYDLPVGAVVEYESPSGAVPIAPTRDGTALIEIVKRDQPWDETSDGGVITQHPIATRYRTRWYDADVDAMRKRWRRLWATYWGDGPGEIVVELFVDYDGSRRRKTWTEAILSQGDIPLWGGGQNWGDGWRWGGAGTRHSVERAVSLGNAHSVQMLFRGPDAETAWGLESLTLPFQRRRVR